MEGTLRRFSGKVLGSYRTLEAWLNKDDICSDNGCVRFKTRDICRGKESLDKRRVSRWMRSPCYLCATSSILLSLRSIVVALLLLKLNKS